MIQFNLLPEVKRQYVRARRNKRSVMLIALLVSGVAVAIFVLLFLSVQIFQKKYSRDLSNDIKTETKKLQDTPDLDKILTIQNQLNSLPDLHAQKPVTTRIFGYLKQVTPAKVSISSASIDFDAHSLSLTGSADAISTVNKFVDTLKFTTYKTADGKEANAFTDVVLSSFGKDAKGASYNISLSFDGAIFDSASDVTLNVPANKITTRSQTEKPEDLFQPLSNPSQPGQ